MDSRDFREPTPSFQELLTKWKAQDDSREHSSKGAPWMFSARSPSSPPVGAATPSTSLRMGSSSSVARGDSLGDKSDKKLPVKKRAIDTGKISPSRTSDSNGEMFPIDPAGTASKGKTKSKKGRKIFKNKNVYQQPLKSLKAFKPKTIVKSTEESEQIRSALRKNFVFSDLDSRALVPLVDAFELCLFDSGKVIIRQGDPGDFFYVIKSGCVVFQVNGTDVGKAKAGASFGELSLLYTCPRAATVVAVEPTSLFRVDQQTFRFILRSQTQQSEQEKISLLRNVDFLKTLNDSDIEKMTRVMTPRVFQENDLLVKKGDHGDAFYIVAEGNVIVKDICVGSTAYEDQTLGPGDYFGERALVTGDKRVANVMALNKGVAFSIDRGTFEKAVGKMSKLVMKAQDTRRLAGVKVLSKANMETRQLAALASIIVDQAYPRGHLILSEGSLTLSALYFVREGKVEVQLNGRTDIVEPGGYFGEVLFVAEGSIISPCTATAMEDSVCGVLAVNDCGGVLDVCTLPRYSGADRLTSTAFHVHLPTTSARLEDLERHAILGEGTFGQVHLVSEKLSDGTRQPYALKIQSKKDLEREGQIEAVIREKNVLRQMRHPFLVGLVAAFQDECFIYILLPMLQGGELFSVLHDRDQLGLPEAHARFYTLCVADALAYMHGNKFVYRDLKPENIIIDSSGYPVIIDFGFAKYVADKTYTLCGTPGYLPPEIVMQRGHGVSADHWSLGILIYELVSGLNPFQYEGVDQITLFASICQDDYDDPRDASVTVIDLIRKLLMKDPTQRLGSLARGEQDILEHPWFDGLDPSALRTRQSSYVPWVPTIKDPLDTSNFDDWSHLEDKTSKPQEPLSEESRVLFESF